jgi:predicted DNA-binding transcriptional regulator YafY
VLRERLRAPIVYDHTRRPIATTTRSPTARSGNLPGLWFTADELRALLTMDQLLADLQPGCCRS